MARPEIIRAIEPSGYDDRGDIISGHLSEQNWATRNNCKLRNIFV